MKYYVKKTEEGTFEVRHSDFTVMDGYDGVPYIEIFAFEDAANDYAYMMNSANTARLTGGLFR